MGHQCYAHKLLTGRARGLRHHPPVRRPLRASRVARESEHDIVGTGHASTSISYGLGLVEAARLARDSDGTVVCVLGDGALTGGVAFEAMNQAGQLRTPLVVVVNDNQMSIQPNVGALQLYLNRIRLDPMLTRLREDLERGVAAHPGDRRRAPTACGKDIKEIHEGAAGARACSSRSSASPTSAWSNGHDMHALRASHPPGHRHARGRCVVHVKTIKGKGYEPAEDARPRLPRHRAVRAWQRRAQAHAGAGTTYTEAFGQALVRLAEARRRGSWPSPPP